MNNAAATLTSTETFKGLNFLRVDETSRMPKYMQIVEIIKSDIKNGIFNVGEQVPSINETSAEFDMAKDTVEKAYKILKAKGILRAFKGKGYYVVSSGKMCSKRGLMLLNDCSEEIMAFYQSFNEYMPENSEVDILLFNGDHDQLERNILANLGQYDYFIILPKLDSMTEGLRKAIEMIPKNQLIMIQQEPDPYIDCSAVINDSREGMYHTLTSLVGDATKYDHFNLVFPDNASYKEMHEGFANYCLDHDLSFEIHPNMKNVKLKKGQLYVVKEDDDLVSIIKCAEAQKLKLGKDIGVICHNDSSLKEILAGGISTFTLSYREMGKRAAEVAMDQEGVVKIKNGYTLVRRGSV